MVQRTATALAQTVLIMNLGKAIESFTTAGNPTGVFTHTQESKASFTSLVNHSIPEISNGTVLFSNNICQLEARFSGEHEGVSVLIFTPDHLTFTSNHCWIDAAKISAAMDALLLAGTLNVTGNRFQEAPNFAAAISGLTAGIFNITSQNISTYCLLAGGPFLVHNNNLTLADPTNERCSQIWGELAIQK